MALPESGRTGGSVSPAGHPVSGMTHHAQQAAFSINFSPLVLGWLSRTLALSTLATCDRLSTGTHRSPRSHRVS